MKYLHLIVPVPHGYTYGEPIHRYDEDGRRSGIIIEAMTFSRKDGKVTVGPLAPLI
jgi:hypothetical protein